MRSALVPPPADFVPVPGPSSAALAMVDVRRFARMMKKEIYWGQICSNGVKLGSLLVSKI